MLCAAPAAIIAGVAADIPLDIVKNRHKRLAVGGQAVLDPGWGTMVFNYGMKEVKHRPIYIVAETEEDKK